MVWQFGTLLGLLFATMDLTDRFLIAIDGAELLSC